MNRVYLGLVAVILFCQAFIDLEVGWPLPFWDLNAPVADWAALALTALLPVLWWTSTRETRPIPPAPYAAAVLGIVAIVSACCLDTTTVPSTPLESLKWTVRKPAFLFIAYAIGLPLALQRLPSRAVRHMVIASIALVAAISLLTSAIRFAFGWDLWWMELQGLTPNHKTLAAWLAPWLPWLWTFRTHRRLRWVLWATLLAVLLSMAKLPIVVLLFGLTWCIHQRGRPLITRWRTSLIALGLLAVTSVALPAAMNSPEILNELHTRHPLGVRARMVIDAGRSRNSINLRAFEMWRSRPLLGAGPGTNTRLEMVEFPHYRVNGVDAHGAFQKVGSELGTLGLLAWFFWLFMAGKQAMHFWHGDTHGERWAWLGVLAALQVSLIASTELFSMTYWVPFGVAWSALQTGGWRLPQRPDIRPS